MGKKKKKLTSSHLVDNPDFEDEGVSTDEDNMDTNSSNLCPHVGKAVSVPSVKKALKTAWCKVGHCGQCIRDKRAATRPEGPAPSLPNSSRKKGGKKSLQQPSLLLQPPPSITPGPSEAFCVWLCLRCGVQCCEPQKARENGAFGHAVAHYKTPRSDLHCVFLDVFNWALWCHECNSQLFVDSYKKLREVVEVVKKATKKPNFITKPNNNTTTSVLKARGLSNLGNTCFFNSVMQCLAQSLPLTQVLDMHCQKGAAFQLPPVTVTIDTTNNSSDDSGVGSENSSSDNTMMMMAVMQLDAMSLQLQEAGPLTLSLVSFLKEMNKGSGGPVLNPGHLFGQVCKRSPQFRGCQQQDSHELLRHLMEGLRAEEVKRQKTAILKQFGLTEKTDPKTVASCTRRKLQTLAKYSNYTLLDKIFGGQLVSTIVCEQCHNSSQIYEPFLDLSLPLVEEKPHKPQNNATKKDDADEDHFDKTKSKGEAKREKERLKKERRKNKKNVHKNPANDDKDKEDEKEPEPEVGKETEVEKGTETEVEKVTETEVEKGTETEVEKGTETEVEKEPETETCDTKKKQQIPNIKKKLSTSSSVFNNSKQRQVDGDEEDDEDGYSEEDEDWEWDYGEQWNEEKKVEEESNDDDEEYEDTEEIKQEEEVANVPKVSLNPLSPERLALAEQEREKSSEPASSKSKEEEDTGASSNADIEDNLEDRDRGGSQLNLFLDKPFKPDHPEEIPNVEALCIKEHKCCDEPTNMDVGNQAEEDTSSATAYATAKDVVDVEEEKVKMQNDWVARSLTSMAPRYHSKSAGECSIYSCLTQFTAPELLTGPNRWACDRCTRNNNNNSDSDAAVVKNVYSNASKQLLVFCPPAVLTIHLKRFQQTMFNLRKVNRHVQFPVQLDLAPFCSSTSISTPNVAAGVTEILYQLFGVVEHSGRLQGGHYTAYVKLTKVDKDYDASMFYSVPTARTTEEIHKLLGEIERKNQEDKTTKDLPKSTTTSGDGGKWFHISDSSVSEVSEEKVLKCQAYLLFYERIK